MSLFIGNLSKHTRKDELEHVFRKFGHCNVQLKSGGYGFVVFDIASDAAKALRALKGGNICGEPLSLFWSDKQPTRNFQPLARGGRASESQRARNSDRLGYARRKEGFNGGRTGKMGNIGRVESVDVPGEERGLHEEDIKDHVGEGKYYGGDLPDEGGGVVPDPRDNGGNENAAAFDRYEPYRGYDVKHDNEDYYVGYSGGSPAVNSQENSSRAQTGKEISSVEDDNKFGSASRVKLRSSVNALSMRHQRDERSMSVSRQHHASLRNELSPITKETDRPRRKESGGKKQSRNKAESPKRSRVKISKQSSSSSLPSDTFRSLSNSVSSKSMPRSSYHSGSRSVSSRGRSSSSKLRSSSKPQYCRGRSLNSRRSSSPTYLSESLNQPVLTSPRKTQLNSKTASINATALESVDHLVAQGQHIGSAMELENIQSKDTGIVVNGNSSVYTTVVDATEKAQYTQEDNNDNHVHLNPSDGVTDSTEPFVAGNLSTGIVKETEGFQHTGALMMDDIPTEIHKPASETHVNCHSGLSTFISAEEMCIVFKNCGLELPKDDEKNLTMDAFLGSARMWPWHIVYYRRLKKGPISTENYARRVAQNQEFGIVDKYIRSSSGWAELSFENSK